MKVSIIYYLRNAILVSVTVGSPYETHMGERTLSLQHPQWRYSRSGQGCSKTECTWGKASRAAPQSALTSGKCGLIRGRSRLWLIYWLTCHRSCFAPHGRLATNSPCHDCSSSHHLLSLYMLLAAC